jgi:hypothetical protein
MWIDPVATKTALLHQTVCFMGSDGTCVQIACYASLKSACVMIFFSLLVFISVHKVCNGSVCVEWPVRDSTAAKELVDPGIELGCRY